ncbi:CheY-like chemotaxis protein [Brevundimonas vesicularis]|uniref:CheY-like chemotaxis protein n=1 Tax=Brevundimonas vesicularis TaxID=41276 RepID=A0A7W9L764_BREVE|nr:MULTISPECIES: response regulator [Brevundimonas]MBB5773157.1 CheY-like chemotaxis protein [Brevundimonas vesicularis]MBC1183962.1 response regulator [Brevundimonas huaxiensis]
MFSLKSLNVLLVDDNQNMRAIAAAVLHSADIRNVYEAAEGATAFDLLRRHAIDLAIVDFNMFPLDGVEFTRLVRTSPDSPNPFLPIIMMTGHSERSRVYEARDAGVTEFIVKPITAKAVLDRLNAVIMRPRPFIKADGYIGPCRRRRDTPDYAGPHRRGSDASRSNAA